MEKKVNLSLRLPKLSKIVVILQVLRSSNSFSFDKFLINISVFQNKTKKIQRQRHEMLYTVNS